MTGGGPVRVQVYVQPRAARTEIAGRHAGRVKIRLSAPPVDNAANAALIEFVAALLGVPKGRVRVTAGLTSRSKTLEIDGAAHDAVARLLGAAPTRG